jgi:hypothetical protein
MSALPDSDTIQAIRKEEVYDKEGRKHVLGELMADRRTLLVFIRHFCMFRHWTPPPRM